MNYIQSSNEYVQREWFHLDQDGKAEDPIHFLEGMEALLNREDLSSKQPGLVEYAFEQISSAIFNDSNTVEKVVEISRKLFGKWMKISMGGHSRYILRSHLANNLGLKFQQQFSHRLKDVKGMELNLDLPYDSPFTVQPNVAESFLMYLQTGIVTIGDEDLLTLLLLARLHCVFPLIEECCTLLNKQLSWDNLGVILEFAVEQQLSRLIGDCLIFVQHHPQQIPVGFEFKQKSLIALAKSLMVYGILLSTTPSGMMQAALTKPTKQVIICLLNQVNDLIPLKSLLIDPNCTRKPLTLLKEIAHSILELRELIFWNESNQDQDLSTLRDLFPKLCAYGNEAPFLRTFEELETYIKKFALSQNRVGPGEIVPKLEMLQLRALNLKAIPNINNTQIGKLTDYISHLNHISISRNNITQLEAPNASKIECSRCPALVELQAPNATWINCIGCTALTELEVPNAIDIMCRNCTALTELEAPNAINIMCRNCTALTELEAPLATRIKCSGCTALTELQAPSATWIDCSDCKAITELQAPSATWIDCSDCKAITELQAPNATWINCVDCTAITELQAPNATWINCVDCTAISEWQAPVAKEVSCKNCSALSELHAPNATWIDCSGCTTLSELEAPNATTVNCSHCTALTTLKAPIATRIDCCGCTALTNLIASIDAKIKNSGCTAIIELQAQDKQTTANLNK